MPLSYHALPATEVVGPQRIVYPESDRHLTMDDPALSVLEDFQEKRPLVIDGTLPVNDAKNFMKSAHVFLKFVVDSSGEFIGIITLKDILGKKAAAKAHEMGVSLGEIQIRDIAQPNSRLVKIHIDHLKNAKVGDVLETFSRMGVEHILVIQDEEKSLNKTMLRGIISATQTAQRVNVSINFSEKARSFSDIVYAVHGHFE